MTGHLDADRLAMFRAGLLGRWRARRAAAHLASCESCAGLDAQLAVLTSVLAAVGPAVTTPPDVVARLDAALAAAQAEPPAPHRARHPARHPAHGKRRMLALPQVSWRVVAPVAAAAALIAAGAGFGLAQIGGGPTSSSAASSAAGAAGAGQQAGRKPVAPVNGLNLRPGMAAPSGHAHGAPSAPSSAPFSVADAVRMVRSDIDFKPGTLRTQVASQLGAIRSLLSRQVPAPPAVATCVLALTGSTSPALVELAHYSGKQALLVAVQRGTVYQVWIAPDACTSSGNVLARLDVPDPAAGTTTP